MSHIPRGSVPEKKWRKKNKGNQLSRGDRETAITREVAVIDD